MNFKTFLHLTELAQFGGMSILPTTWTGSEAPDTQSLSGHPPHLPGLDFALPNVTKVGLVVQAIEDKNPIFVQLQDGTVLLFSHDEYRRMKGDKDVQPHQSRIQVVFQRRADDNSNLPSKIDSCHLL